MLAKYKHVIIRVLFMGAIPLVSIIHIMLNTLRDNTRSIETALDQMIPFVPAFVLPYAYWFLYVFAGLLFLAFVDGKKFYGLLSSIVSGMLVCFVIFYFFPTTVARPEITGNGFFDFGMRIVYGMDNPYNCFPSIHVLNSMLVCMFLMSYNKSIGFNIWNVTSNVLIILSTLFVKQHFVLDAVSAIVIAIVMYMIFSKEHIWEKKFYQKIFNSLSSKQISNDNPDIL